MRRRAALGLLGAALACPATLRAQGTLDAVADRATRFDQLHSLIVMQDGREVLARAPRGPGLDRVANVKSVSKTLLSLLVGVGVGRGVITPADALLPLLGRSPTGDARDDIVLADLLSMRGGLGSTSGGNYGAWVSSPNWVSYALDQPVVAPPGERFIYSTGTTHLLGAALAEAAGDDLLNLFRAWIGGPADVDFAPWVRDPQGYWLGGNDMGISPRDLARIGQVCLDGGAWNGTQVIPADWLEQAWTPRARSPFSGDRYGWGWFLTRLAGHDAAYARGYGGQVLAVVPGLDAVIVITSDPMQPARSGGYFGDLRSVMEEAAAALG